MKFICFIILCFSIIANSNGEEVRGVPNFLNGLNQQKTMDFYAIESGLNLSKTDIVRKKAEWAADLPLDNRIAFERFNDLANQTKIQYLNKVSQTYLSPEANAVKQRIQEVLNNPSLSRTGEVAAIETILAQSAKGIDAELIDTADDAAMMASNRVENIDNNTLRKQPLYSREVPSQASYAFIGDLFRASAAFSPNRAPIFQG